ncbi:uncharacterized protein cubi_03162 [Cryptosporidium ubiquitum]|uniref:Uncharacterized protein n=1 Tax=Cryptosporidium ubiquitum TaxID=857276 RepID=A0A1J4MPX8_9CRYT|nr:uncharacterized protein cubi_03162 [Cryptosporidium ubiquitum]OII75052.1 hypothetical protein cubi_03162 [Cryptosporidium ubiquitum]
MEAIKLSKNETNHTFQINKKTEDECFRFFPSYFSFLDQTELTGTHKKNILALVKYHFLSWINKSDEIQIMNSKGHILTLMEKLELVKKLRESDSQSLVITENYVMYNILFNDSNYNGVFNILNFCDHSDFYKEQNLEPNHIFLNFDTSEFIVNNRMNNKTLIGNEREFMYEENYFFKKILDKYSTQNNFSNFKNDFNPVKTVIFKDLEGFMNSMDNEILGGKSNNKVEGTKKEKVRKFKAVEADKNLKKSTMEKRKKELSKGGKNVKYTYLPKERTNLRKGESKKPYKKIKNSNFYLDKRPIVSNKVYIVNQ